MPAPTRRLFLRGGASLGALAFLTAATSRRTLGRERAHQDFLFQRPGQAGCSSQPAGATIPIAL